MGRTNNDEEAEEEEGSTTNKWQESRGYRDDLAETVEYSTSMAKINGEVNLCFPAGEYIPLGGCEIIYATRLRVC